MQKQVEYDGGMPIITTLRRQRQEDLEFEARLGT
jgi:hypothetical protein